MKMESLSNALHVAPPVNSRSESGAVAAARSRGTRSGLFGRTVGRFTKVSFATFRDNSVIGCRP
jgi:hypothetical protein